ncbi:hypothetical protein BDK92_3504 [Micromonospora pisi]|uniref:Uncharacterized protein n=2 Tax=Micromonospora pisi TaxID=589240 RepID=A0A495JJH3_9ACTN|nr:hypothetical protein BDK92_3504 [Micromonospora pisi]
MELWADAYSVQDGHYLFGILVDASPEELSEVTVTSWPSPKPGRVEILVAKIPASEVVQVESGPTDGQRSR